MIPKDYLLEISGLKGTLKSLKQIVFSLKESHDKTIRFHQLFNIILLVALLLALGYKEAIKIGLLGS